MHFLAHTLASQVDFLHLIITIKLGQRNISNLVNVSHLSVQHVKAESV